MIPKRFPSLGLRDPAFLGTTAGGGITPADLPGVVRWWVSSDLDAAYSDGQLIITPWVDRIISDNAVPHVGLQPTFRTNIVATGSVFCVDGGRHFDFTELTQVALSILFIDCAVNPDSDYIIMSSESGNYQVRWRTQTAPNVKFELYPSANPLLDTAYFSGNGLVVRMSGVTRTAGGVPKFYHNLTEVSEVGGETNVTSMKMQTLGLYNSPGGFSPFHMIECVIGTAVWDLATITAVYNDYFKPTYGLP